MSARAYTVLEIHALRQAVENKWLFGAYNPQILGNTSHSRSFYPEEKTACVEELVRTYMLAGRTAAELYASETPKEQS